MSRLAILPLLAIAACGVPDRAEHRAAYDRAARHGDRVEMCLRANEVAAGYREAGLRRHAVEWQTLANTDCILASISDRALDFASADPRAKAEAAAAADEAEALRR
jgi:hypothetical protein